MLRFTVPRSRGRVIAWGVLLATAAALGVTRWIKASDHKDSALLAADPVTGATSRVIDGPETATVRVSNGETPITASRHGMTVFAGVRDDPFFFDLVQFKHIIAGEATSFRNPGIDTFAGTNVLAIVVELPSAQLGGTKLGVWGTTSRPQF